MAIHHPVGTHYKGARDLGTGGVIDRFTPPPADIHAMGVPESTKDPDLLTKHDQRFNMEGLTIS